MQTSLCLCSDYNSISKIIYTLFSPAAVFKLPEGRNVLLVLSPVTRTVTGEPSGEKGGRGEGKLENINRIENTLGGSSVGMKNCKCMPKSTDTGSRLLY